MKGKIVGLIALTIGVITAFICCFGAIAHTTYAHHKLKIVLDAGHGGMDGGVVGIESGEKESDLNLKIVYFLKDELESAGIEVVLTRSTKAGLYGLATSHFKRTDMAKRREIIQRATPDLVVSVHQNFFSDRSVRGAHVFYKNGDESGKNLASLILANFVGNDGTPENRKPLLGDYYILNSHTFPSVIVECGFLSNPSDEELLISEDYEKIVSDRIARGILGYLLAETNS